MSVNASIEEEKAIFAVLSIATFGGLVNFLRTTKKENFKLSRLVIILSTAAFSGLMVFYITAGLGLSSEYQCAISGMAGYSGGAFLDEVVNNVRELFFTRLKPKK